MPFCTETQAQKECNHRGPEAEGLSKGGNTKGEWRMAKGDMQRPLFWWFNDASPEMGLL
jgi:hypothetical protein